MNRYFEISALPDPEIIQPAVISALMRSLHGLLPCYKGRVGVAFPNYHESRTTGGVIRLLGSEEDIQSLYETATKDNTLLSYGLLTPVETIPGHIKRHACYQRVHTNGNSRVTRLRNRYKARGDSWNDELAIAMAERYKKPPQLPYLRLKSGSTGQTFVLFIKQSVKSEAKAGHFNHYGLSQEEATVPLF